MRNRFSAAIIGLLVLAACDSGRAQRTPDERREAIRAREAASAQPGEATARRDRSHARLRAEGVPINPSLPVIETERESKRRTVDEVAGRALALLSVSARATGVPPEQVAGLIRDYRIEPLLSPAERAFLANPGPSEQDRSAMSWRYESVCVLLWALGYADSLPRPTRECDVDRVIATVTSRRPETFYREARLRPLAEILDEADLAYRYHWATTEARINNQPPPAGLNPDVVMERHYVLNWLIGSGDEEWDDVSTDT